LLQPPLAGIRFPSYLIVPDEHFLLAMCLRGNLICCVCYVLNKITAAVSTVYNFGSSLLQVA